MSNIRLYQFPPKTSPVPADIIYAGDSANAFDEIQITIAQLISAYPNLAGIGGLTLGANTFPYSNNSSVITAGSISPLAVFLLADTTIALMQNTLGYQSAPIASSFSGWDANKNLSAINFLSGYTTTATAAMTTTLTVGSTFQQFFTGTTTQTVLMPVTSTLVLGQSYYIVNNSTGVVTVESSGGNTIQAMAANTTLLVTCISLSGTTAASWSADYTTESSGANFPVNTNITSMSGLTGALRAPTGILDSNGNTVLAFGRTASAVNYITATNNATGSAPVLQATGTDTNVTLNVQGQGTGGAAIQGTGINNNATAGFVGEFVSSVIVSGSPVTATSNAATNVTSISLTAGDWNIYGNFCFTGIGTACTGVFGWSSLTSATVPDDSVLSGITLTTGTVSVATGFAIPFARYSLTTTTTIYLSVFLENSSGNGGVCGGLFARRVR